MTTHIRPAHGINFRKQLITHMRNCSRQYSGAIAWHKKEVKAGRSGYLSANLFNQTCNTLDDLCNSLLNDITRAKALGSSYDFRNISLEVTGMVKDVVNAKKELKE